MQQDDFYWCIKLQTLVNKVFFFFYFNNTFDVYWAILIKNISMLIKTDFPEIFAHYNIEKQQN